MNTAAAAAADDDDDDDDDDDCCGGYCLVINLFSMNIHNNNNNKCYHNWPIYKQPFLTARAAQVVLISIVKIMKKTREILLNS